MADYWIKLYIEILEDAKIGTMPDSLCWRFVQVCLLAGKYGAGGHIPNTPQLAWTLRKNTDDLEHELQQLASVGLIERTVGGWFVTNFAKRQDKMSNAEKQKAYRNRLHREQYQDVTDALPKVTQITDNRLTDNRLTEAERESAGAPSPTAAIDPCDFENLTPRQALNVAEIKTFREATGRMPGRPTYRTVVDVIGKHKLTAAGLQPYWVAWNERGYNPANLAWLTEWAVSGEIPPKNGTAAAKPGGTSKTRAEMAQILKELKGENG